MLVLPRQSIALTPVQRKGLVQHTKELERALALGRRGVARSIVTASFLKDARKRFQLLAQ